MLEKIKKWFKGPEPVLLEKNTVQITPQVYSLEHAKKIAKLDNDVSHLNSELYIVNLATWQQFNDGVLRAASLPLLKKIKVVVIEHYLEEIDIKEKELALLLGHKVEG